MRYFISIGFAVCIVLFMGTSVTVATERFVPAYSAYIDTVIAASAAEDTITITNSDQYEAFDLDKSLLLRASPNETPIIVGASSARQGTIRGLILRSSDAGDHIVTVGEDPESVVFENCTIESDSAGLGCTAFWYEAGDVIVRNCTIQQVKRLVSQSVGAGASISFERCFILTEDGVYMDLTTVNMTECTFVSAYETDGQPETAFTPFVSVLRQCIVSGFPRVFLGGQFYCDPDTMQWNIFHNYSALGCDNVSSTLNMIGVDPLFCEGREESVELYTHRIDTPAIAVNNSFGKKIGQPMVECAWGTLARSTTVEEDASIIVLEDVIVPDTTTLSIQSGGTLSFDTVDESSSGRLVYSENEVTVMEGGELEILGTAEDRVLLRSTASPQNYWGGISVLEGGTATIEYVDFRNPYVGLWADGGGAVSIDHCDFDSSVVASAVWVYAENAEVQSITNSTMMTGIMANGANLEISGNTLEGVGIVIDEAYADVVITGNTVETSDLSTGILVSDGEALLTENTISGNKWGLHVEGDGYVVVGDSTDSGSDNVFEDNTRGLSCTWVQQSSAGALVRNSRFEDNFVGAFVGAESYGSYLDLGSTTQGKNSFVENDSLCIWNRNVRNPSPIPAIGNWFGSYPFDPCWAGSVVVDDPLQSEPAGALVGVRQVIPRLGIHAIWPNPATAEATIELYLGAAVEAEVQVFDVAGRLVKTLEVAGAGEFRRALWDGRDRNGAPVGTGMYFVRVKANGRPVGTGRLLVTR